MSIPVPYLSDEVIERDAAALLAEYAQARGVTVKPPIPIEDIVASTQRRTRRRKGAFVSRSPTRAAGIGACIATCSLRTRRRPRSSRKCACSCSGSPAHAGMDPRRPGAELDIRVC